LKIEARQKFRRGFLKLVTAGGKPLTDPEQILQDVIQEGDSITALALKARVAATDWAFALWCRDGSGVTWGHLNLGGDSSEIQDQLRNVSEVQATESAFACRRICHYMGKSSVWRG
jgi:hypothetical protein